MATDITSSLLSQVQSTFDKTLATDQQSASLMRKLTEGKGKYSDAEQYANRVGKALAKAFDSHVTSATLPDGKMYWNIAERVLEPMFEDAYNLATNAAVTAQETLNKSVGISLKAQQATFDAEELNGVFGKLCNADIYDDVAYVLNEATDVVAHKAVIDTMRDNADFQSGCGMHPKVVRRVGASGCCETCSALAGEYDYSKDMARDVFWRHSHCKCTVDYYPDDGSGRVQNAHTKEWRDEDAIEERKVYAGLDTTAKVDKEQLKTLGVPDSGDSVTGVRRTSEELRIRTEQIKQEMISYANNESLWSGKINIDNSLMKNHILGQKEWSCDITLVSTASDEVLWHEMLHSASASYYGPETYDFNQKIEEGTVQYLTEQICLEKNIPLSRNHYEEVDILKDINKTMNFGTDLDFAKEIYNIPLTERLDKLYEKVYNEMYDRNETVEAMQDIANTLKKLG